MESGFNNQEAKKEYNPGEVLNNGNIQFNNKTANSSNISFIDSSSLGDRQSEKTKNQIKKEKIILFILYFFVFVFINLTIDLILFKSIWLNSRFFYKLFLNYPFYLLNDGQLLFFLNRLFSEPTLFSRVVGFIIFYTYPALLLSNFVISKLKKIENIPIAFNKWAIRPKFIFFVLAFVVILIGGWATYGFFWWAIPTVVLIFLEYKLLLFLSKKVLVTSEKNSTLIIKLAIFLVVLILVYGFIFYNSPIKSCETGKYQCIAVAAAKNNNPKLCEKVGSPYSPKDCYKFLAAANNNTCYCELISNIAEKKSCYEYSFFGDFERYKDSLARYYSLELNEAKFKDDSILKKLTCSNSIENKEKNTNDIISENIARWGITTIVRDWYKSKNTYTGFLEDSSNQEKIRMVIDKIKNEINYNIEYYIYTTSNSFVVKTKKTDNKEAFSCEDRFVGDVKSRVNINGDNFSSKTNCYGEDMDKFIAPNDTPESIKIPGSQSFQNWYETPIKNNWPGYF